MPRKTKSASMIEIPAGVRAADRQGDGAWALNLEPDPARRVEVFRQKNRALHREFLALRRRCEGTKPNAVRPMAAEQRCLNAPALRSNDDVEEAMRSRVKAVRVELERLSLDLLQLVNPSTPVTAAKTGERQPRANAMPYSAKPIYQLSPQRPERLQAA